MTAIDVLLITALKEEYDAARDAALAAGKLGRGIAAWTEGRTGSRVKYIWGRYVDAAGLGMTIALARPTRMGGPPIGPVTGSLVEFLKPRCVAMCGVCAGNPRDVALGDVVIAEMTYQYDEGKRTADAFEGDHRQFLMSDEWLRAAQDLAPDGLPSFGDASEAEATRWLLERLSAGEDPKRHPAHRRYFPSSRWSKLLNRLQKDGLLYNRLPLALTRRGKSLAQKMLLEEVHPPKTLPFEIKVGPVASGNVVVKDGVTWEQLKKWGVRTVVALEMEAATIGSTCHRLGVSHWIVAKGVMDYADPRKDDRFKSFAARASAEVLFTFLWDQFTTERSTTSLSPSLVKSVYVIGGVTSETDHPDFEKTELQNLSTKLGEVIARAGADLVVCSPFPDSADIHAVMGYFDAGVGGKVHFHSPRHEAVREKRVKLDKLLGESSTTIVDWLYPGPETEDAWSQAWLLCQLQALEHADIIIALGGRVSNTANTLLHLAELRRIPVIPFAFLGGASKRAYDRQDWQSVHPGFDHRLLTTKQGIPEAMNIANRFVSDRIRGRRLGDAPPATFFISRASSDSEFADALASHLKLTGFTPLLGDAEVRNGRMVQPSIEEAILKSDVFIVLWSKAYAVSRWCYDELEYALQRTSVGEIRIWLFNLDGTDVIPPRARVLQQAPARTPQALVDAVRVILQESPSLGNH